MHANKVSLRRLSILFSARRRQVIEWITAGALALGFAGAAHAAAVSGQGTWESTLHARDLDGNPATAEAYYDATLDITWLADANAGAGSAYDDAINTTDGAMTWANADAWATSLNFNGITGWRLPATVDADGPQPGPAPDGCDQTPSIYQGLDCGYNITVHSEMSHMSFVTLGNKSFYDTMGNREQPGWDVNNTGPFSFIQTNEYWSATTMGGYTDVVWTFLFYHSYQTFTGKTSSYYAWAVHDGDVGASTVPVPATGWLFGSGLVWLYGMSRKRRRN